MTTEKFCTRCGRKFIAAGREVICPSCKQAAAEDAKRAAVMKAKRASWAGESVPVRISGRASTVIREYGAANGLPFARALDALLQASDYVKSSGKAWDDITPYKSRRRDKATSTPQDKQDKQDKQAADKQDTASKPQDVQAAQEVKQDKPVKQAAKKAIKTAGKKVKE